jgi:hypothetical protein
VPPLFPQRTITPALLCALAASCDAAEPSLPELPTISATEAFTIGVLDGPDEYVFGQVSGVVAGEGQVFVADAQADVIRAYSSEGRYLYTIGRPGGGPGEVRSPCCLALDRYGRLWVRDTENARYNGYQVGDSSATFVRAVRMHHADPRYGAQLTFDGAGHLVDVGHTQSPTGATIISRFHLDSAGGVHQIDEIPQPPEDSLGRFSVDRAGAGGRRVTLYFYQPFGPTHLVAHAPGGSWATAISARYEVRWQGLGEGVEHRIRGPDAGPELSERERASAREQLEASAERAGKTVAALPFGVPERLPPLRGLQLDVDGRLWVHLNTPNGTPRRARVYGPNGRAVGEAIWPREVDLLYGHIGAELAVGIARDSLGVHRVVGLRFE